MTTATAIRNYVDKYDSSLKYFTGHENKKHASTINVKESAFMVDGIGGGVWEGAIIMSNLMEATITAEHYVVELGCGAGLSGIISALTGAKVILTDRMTDLAEENISLLKKQLDEIIELSPTIIPYPNICSCELTWNDNASEKELLAIGGPADFIIGAEIACLRKQQESLTNTIDALSGPQTIVLISFDDLPMSSTDRLNDSSTSSSLSLGISNENPLIEGIVSKYEREMDGRMKAIGYNRSIICTATVTWHKACSADLLKSGNTIEEDNAPQQNKDLISVLSAPISSSSKSSYAVVHEITKLHYNDLEKIAFSPLSDPKRLRLEMNDHRVNEVSSFYSTAIASAHTHHITAYYRPSATSICSRCQKQFFNLLRSSDHSCRHHASYYVCRYHPAELNLSIDSGGDSLGYYGNGKEGWQARFWDCCGNEDQNAPGCVWSCHSSYD